MLKIITPNKTLKQPTMKNNLFTATIQYNWFSLPRQRSFTAPTEEDLFQQIFNFQTDNYNEVTIKTVQYAGKNIEWQNNAATWAHYCFGKGRMSFEEFKTACFTQPKRATA